MKLFSLLPKRLIHLACNSHQMPIFQAAPRPLFRCRLPSPRLFCAP